MQAHKVDNDVRIYTRGLNDVSAAVPEVVAAVSVLPARESFSMAKLSRFSPTVSRGPSR